MATAKMEAASAAFDYPQENQKITSREYTFRIAVNRGREDEIAKVEVRIDKKPAQPCREAVGCYWYDWSGYDAGAHQAVALVTTRDGKTRSAGPRRFLVQLSDQEN